MEQLSLLGILLGLAFLVVLALRGWHILVIAPIAAVIVTLFSKMPLVKTLYGPYMQGFAGFATKMFLIFLTGTIFAKLMEDSGAAESIAEFILRYTRRDRPLLVCLAVVLVTAILAYGGVTVWVVIFALTPIARPLFRDANISWHIFPGVFVFGCWTFTMTMLPGTPQVHNLIPTKYLGTTPTAAPILGLTASVIVFVLGMLYFSWVLRTYKARGLGYQGSDPVGEKQASQGQAGAIGEKSLPNFWVSIAPSVVLLVLLNAFKLDPVYAFAGGIATALVLFWKRLENPLKSVTAGATNSAIPLMNTCADVGFGSVVAATSGFALVKAALANIPGGPLVSMALATEILAGITGSASGGLGIVMEMFAKEWLKTGLNPEIIHRIACIACGGLDTLPHNGAVITLLAVVGLTHKEAYKHMFVSTVVLPIITLILVLPLALAGVA